MRAIMFMLALALVTVPDALGQEIDGNVLINPGFEDGGETPTGWSFNHRRTDGEIVWDAERSHSGARSVRLRNVEAGQTGNVVQVIACDPPLQPGSRVTYSAWVAADGITGNGPRIIFNLLSTDKVRQDEASGAIGGSHDFQRVQATALATRVTSQLVIYLCHYGLGTAWWDDAVLTVEPAQATTTVARPEATRQLDELRSGDGLSVIFSDNGAVASVAIDESVISSPDRLGGLWVQPFLGDAVPVTGSLSYADGEVVQAFTDVERQFRVQATYRATGDRLECEGEVIDLSEQERGVDVIFSLPVGDSAWRWGRSIREEPPLTDEPVTTTSLTFSCVSQPEGTGVSLAVPADSPCDCEFTWDQQFGYSVRYRFGLSPQAGGQFQSRAPFRFVVYRCDGAWGLRDAARRYYALYPEACSRRAERDGLWMFSSPRIELPDPENYAFHEGGPRGWDYDDEHGIYTCPYIIPGQREIKGLEKLPTSNEEALQLMETWVNPTPERGGGWGANMREIIESCMLLKADGLPHMSIRDTEWGGNSVTFPMNANPKLYEDTDAQTIGKVQLEGVQDMHDDITQLDGIYVDSLGAWGDYDNFRAEHFAYTQTPLTYDRMTGKPVINNRFTLLEFLWGLRDFLHERGKLLFANGVHHNRRFHALACDILGVEGRSGLEQKRTIAGQKPFLLLIYNIHTDLDAMENWYNQCGFYGIYPSFGSMNIFRTPESYAPVARLNSRYVPVMRQFTEAGWEPITHARSSDPEVWLERWGADAQEPIYLTAYNSGDEQSDVTISVAVGELDRPVVGSERSG